MPRTTSKQCARRAARGATLVEYALAVTAVCLAIAGAANLLTNAGQRELANQADCVASRPPPPSCQIRAITTTTGVGPPTSAATTTTASTTTTTAAPTTTTTRPATTTTAAPTTTTTRPPTTTTTAAPTTTTTIRYNFAATASGVTQGSNNWRARVTVTVTPSANGTVTGEYRANGSGSPISFSCTLSGGTCTFASNVNQPNASVNTVVFTVQTSSLTPNNLSVTATANRP